jgi:hypothetical protein
VAAPVGVSRSLHPGRSRHLMFALCRRFPLELLPLAARQLQGVGLGGTCSNSSSSVLGPFQPVSPSKAGWGPKQPCTEDNRDRQAHDQQAQLQQGPQHAAGQDGSSNPAEQPPGSESVSLQLQIQRAAAAKLVRCEVVACS